MNAFLKLVFFFIVLAYFSYGATIVLDPDTTLAEINCDALLSGTNQVFENIGGIVGLNLTVSLNESVYIDDLSSNSGDGFWMQILGTSEAPGDARGALGLKFSFTTTGDEVVESFRMYSGAFGQSTYALLGQEWVSLTSPEGSMFTGCAVDGHGTVYSNETCSVSIQGGSGTPEYDFDITSVTSSTINPISEVDFCYYQNSRPAWNNNQLISFEITTVPRPRVMALDPETTLSGIDYEALLCGTNQVFENLGGISGLDLTISLNENAYATNLTAAGGTDGFYAMISGTGEAPGTARGALGLTFTFTTTGDEVVSAFRVYDGVPVNTAYKLISSEALSLGSAENITFSASVGTGGGIGSTGTTNACLWGLSDGDVYRYKIASENGSAAHPISSVAFCYYLNNRTVWNNNQLFSFEITTMPVVTLDPHTVLSGIDCSALLQGTPQVFEDVAGIGGLDLTVSRNEMAYVDGLTANTIDGFWMQIAGQTAQPGSARGALGLKFAFTTNGTEVVNSFQMMATPSDTYKLNSDERVLLCSPHGNLFTGTVDDSGIVYGDNTTNVVIAGGSGDVCNFAISSTDGQPVSDVDFCYYLNNRHSWSDNQLITFKMSAIPVPDRLFPEYTQLGISSWNASYIILDNDQLEVYAQSDTAPQVSLTVPSELKDWSGYRGLSIEVFNDSDQPIRLAARVDSQAGGTNFSAYSSATIAGETHEYFLFPVSPGGIWMEPPASFIGMQNSPLGLNNTVQTLVKTNVQVLTLYLDHQDYYLPTLCNGAHFRIGEIALEDRDVREISDEDLFPFVDRYGQYIHDDWPEKIAQDCDLTNQLAVEQADLSDPCLYNQYGGWTNSPAPQLTATGWFRTQKLDGKWWLVDPSGRLFWSYGVNYINLWPSTVTEDRENYFEWLPEENDPLADFYSTWSCGTVYSFLRANLSRKYGSEFETSARTMALQRLRHWNMNTIGAWSDNTLMARKAMPYTYIIEPAGVPCIEGSTDSYGIMPDVFDPAFVPSLSNSIQLAETRLGQDSWCIGFFVNNELGWGPPEEDGDLGLRVLRSPGTQAAKQAFMSYLQSIYGSIGELNASWGTSFNYWNGWLNTTNFSDSYETNADCIVFTGLFAEEYFSTVKTALAERFPNHLYLGCRFAGWGYNDTVAAVAADYCDVVSCNWYLREVYESNVLPDGTQDRPLLLSEFHFIPQDSHSHFSTGFYNVKDGSAQVAALHNFMQCALVHPKVVGAHWFPYYDMAVTGRSNGENSQVGLVSITDYPHSKLIQTVTEIGRKMYQVRTNE